MLHRIELRTGCDVELHGPRINDAATDQKDLETLKAPVQVKLGRVPFWWALRDSNPRPSPCKGDALAN